MSVRPETRWAWPLVVLFIGHLIGELASGADQPLTPDEVQQAITDLGQAEFAVRSAAQERLLGAGGAVVDPLLARLNQSREESGRRVLSVLEQIWLRTPEAEADAIEKRLEQLMLTPGPWQPQVEQILLSNHELRESRAVRALRRMNALVEFGDDDVLYTQLREEGIEGRIPQKLKHVTLPKSWKGGDEGLWHVGRLFHRGEISFYLIPRNGITEEGLNRLQTIYPTIKPVYRSEVCMGIEWRPILFGANDGCLLNAVHPGGSADQAGLRPNDRIISVDDQPVSDFDGLVDSLKGRRPYEQCEMVIDRGGSIRTVNVVLLPWEVFLLPRPPAPLPARRLKDELPVRRFRLVR